MPSTRTSRGLTHDERSAFERDGFLAIDQLLAEEDLQPIEAEYAALLDRLVSEQHAAGQLSGRFEDLSFAERYARVIGERPDLHCFFNISLPLINGPVEEARYHLNAGPSVFGLLRHPKVLDLVEDLIGGEIYCSPVQQMRMKPPAACVEGDLQGHSNIGATTWHQDIVALLPDADETEQVTVWLAISEATEENGCLLSVPGSHRDGPQVHCSNDELASEPHVPTRLMEGRPAVSLPVKRGGLVLFHKMNLHCALPNRSQCLRWSMDLRYHPIGQGSGRPAFPGFVARSRKNPASEARDPEAWAAAWEAARQAIVSGRYPDRIFEDRRWNDAAVC